MPEIKNVYDKMLLFTLGNGILLCFTELTIKILLIFKCQFFKIKNLQYWIMKSLRKLCIINMEENKNYVAILTRKDFVAEPILNLND